MPAGPLQAPVRNTCGVGAAALLAAGAVDNDAVIIGDVQAGRDA